MASCTCAWRCSPAKSSHMSPRVPEPKNHGDNQHSSFYSQMSGTGGGGGGERAERIHLVGLPRSEFQLQIGGRVIGGPKPPSKTFPVVQDQAVCSYLPPPGCPQPPLGQGRGRLPCTGLSTCTDLNPQPRWKAIHMPLHPLPWLFPPPRMSFPAFITCSSFPS